MIMMSILIMNCILAISMKNTISLWYMMEMESLIFIFFLMKNKNPNKSSIIYFIMSFISSILIVLSFSIQSSEINQFSILMKFYQNPNNLMTLAFLMKMGAAPLHMWLIKMIYNMEWMSIMTLLTIQKIIPIWALIMTNQKSLMLFIFILGIPLLMWLPFNSKNSFFLLSVSSIMNNLWIMMMIMSSLMATISYSISYFIATINLTIILKKNNSKVISSSNPILIMISVLSVMGFPPLPMFFMKLMTIKNLLNTEINLIFLSLALIIMNMFSSIMYMKSMNSQIMSIKNSNNWKKTPSNYKMVFLSTMISQVTISIMSYTI